MKKMTNILDSVISVPCHPKNRGGTRPASAIQYIAFHYTGNDGDTDANNARYYRDNVVQASAHYFVDDDLGGRWQEVGGLSADRRRGALSQGHQLQHHIHRTV